MFFSDVILFLMCALHRVVEVTMRYCQELMLLRKKTKNCGKVLCSRCLSGFMKCSGDGSCLFEMLCICINFE